MTSRPKSRLTDAGLRLRVIRGPRRAAGRVEWYWAARERGGDRKTVWTDWATEQEAGPMADAALASHRAQAGLTVGEVLERYLAVRRADAAAGQLGASTLDSYVRCVARVTEILGQVPADDLTDRELVETSRLLRESNYSPRTVDQTLRVWRLAWRWALGAGLPVADLHAPKIKVEGHTNNHRTPTGAEVERMLSVLSGVDRLAVELMAQTGARVGEVAELVCEDVHPTSGAVVFHGKTGARTVHPPAPLMAQLVDLLHDDPDDRRLFRWPDGRSGKGVVRFGQQRIRSIIRGACQAAGVEPFTPHGLRRAMVRRLLREGVDVGTAAAVLGHSPTVMLQVYDQVAEEDRRRAVEKVALSAPAPGETNVIRGPWGKADG